MLSTTTNSKGKSSKNLYNPEATERDEIGYENTEYDKVRGYVGSYDASSSYGGSGKESRYRGRGRVTEFRHSRGDRRGSGRGRAGYPFRTDRDPTENSYKYQESLSHSNADTWNQTSGSKFYEKSELAVNLPEDPRISKLLRRLCAEVDIEKSLIICRKLQEAIMLPENSRYIRRSYDILVESLLDVLYDGPGPETKESAAIALGRIGYVMGPDYRKHLDWVASQYSVHNSSIKHLLTLSFSETFQLDYETSNLNEYAKSTMEHLQNIIEGTDSPDIFIAAINAMIIMSNSYPEHFANHFVDTVDILVGWHVDNSQPKKIKDFALQSLLKLSRHWQADVGFSINLLNQFIEDMVVYANILQRDPNEKAVDTNDDITSKEDCIQKLTSFLNVFNSVVKSLGALLSPNASQTVTWSYLTETMIKVLEVITNVIKENADEDLIIAGNDCITLLMDYLQTKMSSCSTKLFDVIYLEMEQYLQLDENVSLSIIGLIIKTIKGIASNLPIEFITQIIGPGSLLRPLRFTDNKSILLGIMSIYINLLNLKNIPLLQETYKYVLTDIQNSYSLIVPGIQILQVEYEEQVMKGDAEKSVIFYLQCLSELANASNSIIGMWALQPSILELLAVKMCPHNESLMIQCPALQYSILYLLYSHCKKNNHFIASSDLVSNSQMRTNDMFGLSNLNLGEVPSTSPTSGHLAVIINILSIALEKDVPYETLLLLLHWTSDIICQLEKYLPIVSVSKVFICLVTNMLALGYSFDIDVVMLVMKNSQNLLKNKNLTWNILILKSVATLCLLHIDNRNRALSKICFDVLFELPWDIVQLELDKQKITVFTSRKMTFQLLNHDTKNNSFKEYLLKGSSASLSTQHFKMLMNCLLELQITEKNFVIDAFLTTWPLIFESDENNLLLFRQCALNFSSICIGWALSELAQSCVVLKLRTPLGKPQETFMKIESSLKTIAREISSSDSKYLALAKRGLIDVVVGEQSRTRWISEFMMFLEKYIYNAAEGTAIVLPAVTKPVKTFFHTNWPTCREWLTRVRPAALAVSLYAGHLGAAVYHGEVILQVAASSATNIDIEAITISTARALIKLQESDVLHGLYVWVNKTFGKKYHWLKAAADQANSKYELSLDTYKKLKNSVLMIEDEKDSSEAISLGSKTNHFIDEQIMESYKNLQHWEDMRNWIELEHENKCVSQWDSFHYLELFEGNVEIPDEFGNWNIIDLNTSEMSKNQSSYQGLINKIEATLIYTAINMYYEESIEKYENLLKDCNELLDTTFEEFTRHNSTFFLKDVSVLQLATKGLRNMIHGGKSVLNPFKPSSLKDHKFGTTFDNLSRIFWWNQYFAKMNMSEENAYYAECLRLDVIRGARKSINLKMANRELLKYFKHNATFQMYLGDLNTLEDLSDVFLMTSNTYELDIWTLNNVTALMEFCKLTYENDTTKTKAIDLCASISLGLSQRLAMGEQSYELREKGTRMLLTLSKWVQNENVLIGTQDSPLTKLVTALPEIGLVDNKISENVIPLSDSAVGKLLQFSVNQCPGLAKAWANFAAWCFRWGRKMVEYSSKTRDQLTDSDKLQIESVMIGCSPQDYEAVCEILSKTKATCDDEDIDWNEINTSDMIESQLRTVASLSHAFSEHLALLVDIWRQAQKRVFSYFELSADAYFKFLQLICASDYINHSGEYAVVSATLRLLRLIVKHAMELQTVLESGLANTPTQPWKVIIPQLFSRLNHPETYVRKCVSDLLCRLAEDTPHLITFPAVVGAVENEQRNISELNVARSYISNDTESGGQHFSDCDEMGSDKIVNNELNSCFLDMVETLANQAPTTILQVKLLVKELQRINLLWDELWLGTLVQHHSEFSKRLSQLETEIAKVKNNLNLNSEDKVKLIKEKHRIIFEPILSVLEQLNQITSAQAETPHETNFQAKFQMLINEVIDKLKNPVNPDKPQESWAPLKQLQIKLQQKVNKRASYVLKMADISPVLAGLKNTVISMPGVQTHQRAIRVTIKSIENNVAILPTKTRPKKLVFHGSDGKSYIYLFKGLEDLHLDERIMQLLSIVNTMMARDSENNENQTYRARHYSVIPLGPRSGLISWVDNVTPLFALYKRWQNREAAILSAKKNKTVNVLRPSELFYNKLNPLLQEAGLTIDNRKEWPFSVLKQVLTELSTETPRDLLWRELWCGSVTPEQWWQMVRRYSYSVAVMSTIGYIIGLGDRHLDNVLVDLTSGEVVHIDYNVCFEKGKTLRVPEKVPFRMTPNLVTALGVTGVEGIFRLACEHVLRAMRRGRETLLTLLEAFVYDPLVEWGAGGGAAGGGAAGGRRRRSQRDARTAHAMLAVRAHELRHDLAENIEQFLRVIPDLQQNIESWLQEDETLRIIESRLQECHQQMALVKEIEAYGPNLNEHPLYAISQKYTTYKQAKNAVEDSMKALVKILKDFDAQIESFVAAEDAVRGPLLMTWVREFGAPAGDREIEPIFRHIEEFLSNAGQSGMLAQCERAEAELGQAMQQAATLVRATLELLTQYAAVAQYYPRTHTEQYRVTAFREWLAAALEARSPDVCRDVTARLAALVAAEAPPPAPLAQQIATYNYRLQALSVDATAKLNEAFEHVQHDAASETSVDDAYEEAKSNISSWLRAEDGAAAALECVVVGSLCALNRRYLMLESGAQSAGDCLAELTSRDGEWFLDEMCALSTQAVEALSLLPLQAAATEDPAVPLAVECVRDANRALDHLLQLNHNFSTVILPEALKKLHAEEPCTLRLVEEMEALVAATPMPLPELVAQLDLHLRYLLMDMESPASECQLIAADLRARYEALVAAGGGGSGGAEGDVPQSEGRMLLLGFNGLFAALEAAGPAWAAVERLAARIPTAWRKIDQINLAMHMSAALQSESVRAAAELAVWVRRVQAVSEVLAQCAQHAAAFRGIATLATLAPPDHIMLCKPVRRFTAELVSRRLLGVPSRALGAVLCLLLRRARLDLSAEVEQKEIGASWTVPLESLCEKAREASGCGPAQLERAGVLYAAAEHARRAHRQRAALARRLDVARAQAHCTRLRLAAHSQLHADVLGNSGNIGPALARHARDLAAAQERLAAAQTKAQTLLTQAHQRVKWGAGANPALTSVMVALESSWAACGSRAEALVGVAGRLVAHARAAAHQRTRTSKLARTARQALAHWEKACTLALKYSLDVSPIEESLMEMLHPEGNIDGQWVENVSALIREMITQLSTEAAAGGARRAAAAERVRGAAEGLAPPLGERARLSAELRAPLDVLKHAYEGNNLASELLTGEREVSELGRAAAAGAPAAVDGDAAAVRGALRALTRLAELLPKLQQTLHDNVENKWWCESGSRRLTRQSAVSAAPRPGGERNAQGAGVWKRVRLKLEGRDPDPARRATPHEQVEYIISEATSADNLCQMYEGWMAWV